MSTHPPRITIDCETRSNCSLKKSGAWRYALDATTEVLCLAYRLPGWKAGRTGLWYPDFPQVGIQSGESYDDLSELCIQIADGALVEAHNAWFERSIWTNILIPRFGFPVIRPQQWRCSAAKAAAHALPRGLDDALRALKLTIRKDELGSKVMMKMAKPRKSRKAEREKEGFDETRLLWWEERPLFEQLWAYCRQDVLAEEALSMALADLSVAETKIYLLDQQINERGFQLDPGALATAQHLVAKETVILNRELAKLTGGEVKKATQRAQMMAWLKDYEGLELYDTQAATLDLFLSDESQYTLSPLARRALEIMRMLGRSSTAKYDAMSNWRCPDNRVRGGLLYHGASTGRWSGSGVQPHNFPKGSIKSWDMDLSWEILNSHDRAFIVDYFGSVMEPLAQGLRGAIVAAPGRQLYVADYAAIEARVVLWLAGDEEALQIFRDGRDIYCEMASEIYQRPVTKADKEERALGKIAILGLGYQMGAAKFVDTCAKFGIVIDEDLAQLVITTYREKFWRVKQLWTDQEAAAIEAVRYGHASSGLIKWEMDDPFLYAVLPSGRRLSYPFPEIREKVTPWGAVQKGLTFMGIAPFNHKWMRQHTYGGSVVENLTQAIARDLMAGAIVNCAESVIYDPVLSVHDELIAEADMGAGSVEEFTQLVAKCPPWAYGMPIEADGWCGVRYHK